MRTSRPPTSDQVRALLGCSALLLALAVGIAVGASIGSHPAPVGPSLSEAPLGTAFSIGLPQGVRLAVAAVQVVDPVVSADPNQHPGTGEQYVGVNFLLVNTGSTGTAFDVGATAELVDDEGQAFSPHGLPTGFANCPNANARVEMAAGSHIGVCVPFEVPRVDDFRSVVMGDPPDGYVAWNLAGTGS